MYVRTDQNNIMNIVLTNFGTCQANTHTTYHPGSLFFVLENMCKNDFDFEMRAVVCLYNPIRDVFQS
jgi:hypothetical protein